jgi:hypothetical protein
MEQRSEGNATEVKDDDGVQPPLHSAITIVSLQLKCALPSPALIGGPSDHAFTSWPTAAFPTTLFFPSPEIRKGDKCRGREIFHALLKCEVYAVCVKGCTKGKLPARIKLVTPP